LGIGIPFAILIIIIIVLVNNKKKLDANAMLSQANSEVPVAVTTPQLIEKNSVFDYSGTVHSQREVAIIAKAQGNVIAKYKTSGDRVTAGTPVAKIEDNVIRENLRIAELNYRKAQADVKRYQYLLKENVISKSEMEAVEISGRGAENVLINLREQLKNTVVLATANGIIEKDAYETGSYVAPGSIMGEIVDPEKLKVVINVTENDAARIRKGDTVSIRSSIYPDTLFKGKVNVIGTRGNTVMTYYVEILFDTDYVAELKPGMFVNVSIHSRNAANQPLPAIERMCITGSIKNPKVFVIENGRAYERAITVGEIVDDKVIILSGLSGHETVVRSGQINLADNTPVVTIK